MNTTLRASLASAGEAHPITRIFPDPKANEEAWKKIPSVTTNSLIFNTTYLEKIREFVEEGGGFAMLGGIRSFDSGGYFDSPLSKERIPPKSENKSPKTTRRISKSMCKGTRSES